jgi:PAS domain S-box-containing protein
MNAEIQKMIADRKAILDELTITGAVIKSFNDENSPILLVVFDSIKLEFIKVSKSSFKILGYKAEEMEGSPLSNYLLDDDLRKSVTKANQNLLAGEPIEGFENYYLCKNGKNKRKMTWFNGSQNHQKVFALALPGQLINVENEPK